MYYYYFVFSHRLKRIVIIKQEREGEKKRTADLIRTHEELKPKKNNLRLVDFFELPCGIREAILEFHK